MKIYKKHIYITFIFLLGLAVILFFSNQPKETKVTPNTRFENDIQIIDVNAKSGGYSPKLITAQAGIETKLKITSTRSYGCERAFRIPSLGISKTLPAEGITEFDIPSQESGKKIIGTCSMGMYSFTINFK